VDLWGEKERHVEAPGAYIPIDRRHAMARDEDLPNRVRGAALFADISGFTPLTEALVQELGPRRAADELTWQLNRVYDALIAEVHRYGGSVLSFAGDAITCWLDGDDGRRATACALALQDTMAQFAAIRIPSGKTVSLAMKAAVATGPARRFVVGDPQIQIIDVLAGATLDSLAQAEHQAGRGEVVLDPGAVVSLGDEVRIAAWRSDEQTAGRFGVVEALVHPVATSPWPETPLDDSELKGVRPWLLPPVYERLSSGQGEFLAELRPAVALFVRFGGIDYDRDERAGAKLGAYIRWVQSVLVHYGGYLLQLTMGDKGSYLYAVFGAPIAHEDDAVRAVSAALNLQDLPAEMDGITNVQIGISRGRMRTGAYGGSRRRTYGVLGDDVNLAARLMQAAEPGQILVSPTARQATREVFAWQDLPAIRVKGKAEPVPVYSPLSVRMRRALCAHRAEYALPMVGRKTELARIEEKLALALQGQGQIFGITGEAGIGKTRLVAEVIRVACDAGLVGYASECESYGTNTSYLVWQPIWRALFDVDPGWTTARQVSRVETQLEAIDPTLAPRLPLLGVLLNLVIPDNDLTRTFDAKLRKASLETLLVDCLRAYANKPPLLLVLEDCHWLDPLSHDLLEVLGRAIYDLPVLMVLAYRPPEVQRLDLPRVNRLGHFYQVELGEFTPQETERLIAFKLEQFSGAEAKVPPGLLERIADRAEGNPFYVEELMNYLRDRGIDPQDSRAWRGLDLPESLDKLILSRLDQRPESQRTILRVASVIGRVFRAVLLWATYPEVGVQERVLADLEDLCRLDLTRADTPEPELAYLFKHIVTQEVAYESLPYATRARLHGQLAQHIEETYHETLNQYVDLLAFHYDRSENQAKRREYLLKAADAAQADYANQAAMDYYQRLLPLLSPEERVPVTLKLGHVLELVGEWGEAEARYREALALAEELEDGLSLAWSQAALGELRRKQGQYPDAAEWFEVARAGFGALGEQAGSGQVLQYAGTLAAQQGDYETARALWGESLLIRQALDDKAHISALYNNLGLVAHWEGDLDAARAFYEQSLEIHHELGDKWALAISLNNLGYLAIEQKDYEWARIQLRASLNLQREVGDRHYLADTLTNLGIVARDLGDYREARELLGEGLAINVELDNRVGTAYVLEEIAGLAVLLGRARLALRLSGAAGSLREKIGAPLPPAEQSRLEGLLQPAREALDPPAIAAAVAEGRAWSLGQAIEGALGLE